MNTLDNYIRQLKDDSKVIIQEERNAIKNFTQQEENKGKLDEQTVKQHDEFLGNNTCNEIVGFRGKPWPKVTREKTAKPFEHKNFFARYYACRPGSKTDGESKYSIAFLENFDKKMKK